MIVISIAQPDKAHFETTIVAAGNSKRFALDPILLKHLDYNPVYRIGLQKKRGQYGPYATLYPLIPDGDTWQGEDRADWTRKGYHTAGTVYITIPPALCIHLNADTDTVLELQTEHGQYGPYVSFWNPVQQRVVDNGDTE